MRFPWSPTLGLAAVLAAPAPAQTPSLASRAYLSTPAHAPSSSPYSSAIAAYVGAMQRAPHGLDISCFLDDAALAARARLKHDTEDLLAPRDTVSRVNLHVTEWPLASAQAKLCTNGDAHALITKTGTLILYVPPTWDADDAGRGVWHDSLPNRNAYSIEFDTKRTEQLTKAQQETGRFLINYLVATYRLDRTRDFVWHYQMASQRVAGRESRGRRYDGICQRDETLGIVRPTLDEDAAAKRVVGWPNSLAELRKQLHCAD